MTVTNPYYEFTPEFIPGTKVRSDAANLQFQALQNAFDFLPGANDALTTGTATFGPESGSGNAYEVTMPDTRTAENDGDEVIFFATHTNTGAPTLEVDGLGAKAIVRADGTAAAANDLQSGLLYVLRYDATNTRYQLVGPSTSYLTDATAQAAAAAASAAAALTSENNAAASAVEAMQWAVHPEDDDVDSAPGQFSAFHWAQKALAAASLSTITGDINTATPPTTEAVTAQLVYEDADNTDTLAQVGFSASNEFVVHNRMHGGVVSIASEDSAGSAVTMISADPDGGVVLFNPTTGNVRARTLADHFGVRSEGNTDAEQRGINFQHQDGTNRAIIRHNAGVDFIIRNQIHGGLVLVEAENAIGTVVTLLTGDPDGRVVLYQEDVAVARTLSAANGGFQVNNTFSGAGFERVLTASDGLSPSVTGDINTATPPTTEAVTARLEYYDADQTDLLSQVGFLGNNTFYAGYNQMHGGDVRLAGQDTAGTFRIIFNGDPDGGSIMYHAGNQKIITTSSGGELRAETSPGIGSAQDIFISLAQADAADVARFGFVSGSAIMNIESLNHGSIVRIRGEDTGGTVQNFLQGDPDANTTISAAGDVQIQVAGNETAIDCNANGTVQLHNDSIHRFRTNSSGRVDILSDGSTDTEGRSIRGIHSDGTERWLAGNISDGDLRIINRVHGAAIQLEAEDTGGVLRNLFSADPDGTASIYHAGTLRADTNTLGRFLVRSDGNTDAEQRQLNLAHQDGTVRGQVGYPAADAVLKLRNLIDSGSVEIQGNNSVGATTTLIDADPDGGVELFNSGSRKLDTAAASINLFGDVVGSSPPVPGDNHSTRVRGFNSNGSEGLWDIGFLVGADLQVRSTVHGAIVTIGGQDSAGTLRTILSGDPDAVTTLRGDTNLTLEVAAGENALNAVANAQVDIYYDNTVRLSTTSTGAEVVGDLLVSGTSAAIEIEDAGDIHFRDDVGSTEGIHILNPANTTAAQNLRIESTAATPRVELRDGIRFYIYDAANTDFAYMQQIRASAPISFDFITVGSGVDSFFFNEPIAIAESAAPATNLAGRLQLWALDTAPNQLWFTNDGDIDYPVATAAAKRLVTGGSTYNFNTGSNAEDAINGILVYTNGSSYTVTCENSTGTDFPIDAAVQIIARGAGTITISEGTGMTLYTNAGSGWVDSAGSSTLSDGMATLYRYTTTEWYLWGNGLTP